MPRTPLLALVLAGCAFVTENEVNTVLDAMDADDDGIPALYDCDDGDPRKRPSTQAFALRAANLEALPATAPDSVRALPTDVDDSAYVSTEIVADAVDNDCSGEDLVDGDGDGFAADACLHLPVPSDGCSGAPDSYADPHYCRCVANDGPIDRYHYIAEHVEGLSATQAPWPSGIRNGLDCNDADANVFPGAQDDWYDGVDADCLNDNDFDQDLDDFMPDGLAADAVAYAARHPGSIPALQPLLQQLQLDGLSGNALDAALASFPSAAERATIQSFRDGLPFDPFGDCLDTDNTVRPDAATDTPYDGVDQDCSGDNDFDQDGDGYYPEQYTNQFATFVQIFHPETAPVGPDAWGPGGAGGAQPGDCLDVDFGPAHPLWASTQATSPELAAALQAVPAAQVYAGAPDLPYDGVDADCAGDNDYDQDGDRHMPPPYDQATWDAYADTWIDLGTMTPLTRFALRPDSFNDCVDDATTEPQAPFIHPGKTEALLSPLDYDCDGDPATSASSFGSYLWDEPTRVRLAHNSNQFFLATTANRSVRVFPSGFDTVYELPGMVLSFDALDAELTQQPGRWGGNAGAVNLVTLGPAFDMMVDDNDFLWLAATYTSGVDGLAEMVVSRRAPTALVFTFGRAPLVGSPNRSSFSVDGIGSGDLDLDLLPGAGSDRHLVIISGQDDDPDGTAQGFVRVAQVENSTAANLQIPLVGSMTYTGDGATCAFTDVDEATVCDSAGCVDFALGSTLADAVTEVGPSTSLTATYNDVDRRSDGLLVLAHAGPGGGLEVRDGAQVYTFFEDPLVEILRADATWADTDMDGTDDTLLLAVVTQSDNGVRLRYGWTTDPTEEPELWHAIDPRDYDSFYGHRLDSELCSTTEPPTQPGRLLEPTDVAIDANRHRVGIGFTALSTATRSCRQGSQGYIPDNLGHDALGYLFMSFHPDADNDGYPASGVVPALIDPNDNDPAVTP